MELRYALIGCGRVSGNHMAAAAANKLRITAVCDLNPRKLDVLSDRFPEAAKAHHYTDYRKMLEVEKPDLVAIATESGKHAAIALDALDAGCHVIIEKPIALSIADADTIIAKARAKGVKVSACHQNRFNLAVRKLREAVEMGRFGKLLHGTAHIRWSRSQSYYQEAPWRGTWAQDGGTLMNQCIHNIDLLRWMMGEEITKVMAMTDRIHHPDIEAEDLGLGLIKFTNGSYGLIEGTVNIYPTDLEATLNIFGEKGTVKLGGLSVNAIETWLFDDQLDNAAEVKCKYSEKPTGVYGFGHRRLYADVCDAIINDREPYVTAEDGRKALELVLALYKSAAQGTAVELPLKEGSTLEYLGRFD